MPATLNEFDLAAGFNHTDVVNRIKSAMVAAGLTLVDENEISATNRDLIYRFECVGYQPSFQRININGLIITPHIHATWDSVNKNGTGTTSIGGQTLTTATNYKINTFNSPNKNQIAVLWQPNNVGFGIFQIFGFFGIEWSSPQKAIFPNGLMLSGRAGFRTTTINPVSTTGTSNEVIISNLWRSLNLHTGNVDALRNCPVINSQQFGIVGTMNDEFLVGGLSQLSMNSKFAWNNKIYANIVPAGIPGFAIEVVS